MNKFYLLKIIAVFLFLLLLEQKTIGQIKRKVLEMQISNGEAYDCNFDVYSGQYSFKYNADGITGVYHFDARDEVKIIAPSVATQSTKIVPCALSSYVIKADPTIVLPIVQNPNSGSSSNTQDYYVSLINGYTSTDEVVGMISDWGDITPSGSANYVIPINVPQGPKGLQPSISINYNSQSQYGLLGWGWDLAGISKVYLAPKNLYYDGISNVLDFKNVNNRFNIDGNRLILDDGGDLINSISATFKYEYSNFEKIEGKKSAAAGPFKNFIVTDRQGNTLNYGGVNESDDNAIAYSLGGNNHPTQWAIRKAIDLHGNEIIYEYDNTDVQHRISSIRYGPNGIYEVIFKYSHIKDEETVYYNANTDFYDRNIILESIVVLSNGNFLREYSFDYAYDANISKLVKVNLVENDKTINPTIIQWQTQNPTLCKPLNIHSVQGMLEFPFPGLVTYKTGDFNGDHLLDVLVLYNKTARTPLPNCTFDRYQSLAVLLQVPTKSDAAETNFEIAIGAGDQYIGDGIQGQQGLGGFVHFNNVWVSDYNNDGIDDIFIDKTGFDFGGTGEETSVRGLVICNMETNTAANHTAADQNATNYYVFKQLASYPITTIKNFASSVSVNGDFDGDGKTDVFTFNIDNSVSGCECNHEAGSLCEDEGYKVENVFSSTLQSNAFDDLFTNHGKIKNPLSGKSIRVPFHFLLPINYDGDNRTELIGLQFNTFTDLGPYFNEHNTILASKILKYKDGQFSILEYNTAAITENKALIPILGDFNADGYTDIFGYYDISDGNVTPRIYLGNGNGFAVNDNLTNSVNDFIEDTNDDPGNPGTNPNASSKKLVYSGDFNGDGRSDLVYIVNNPSFSWPTIKEKYIFKFLISNGNAFSYSETKQIIDDFAKKDLTVDDFDHDGKSDIMIIDQNGTSFIYYINQFGTSDDRLVSSITNGLKMTTEFQYDNPIQLDYFYNNTSNPFSFPLVKASPNRVVTFMRSSDVSPNGVPIGIRHFYSYSSGAYHRTGKGFLGFQEFTEHTSEENTTSVKHFNFDEVTYYPYVSLVKNFSTAYDGSLVDLLSTTTNNFNLQNIAGIAYFPYVSKSTVTDDLHGTTEVSEFTYDLTANSSTFGYLKNSLQTTRLSSESVNSAGSVSVNYQFKTSPTVLPNGFSVYLPNRRSSTKIVGSGSSGGYSRYIDFTTYDPNGRVTEINTDNSLKLNYQFDDFGNISSKTETYTEPYPSSTNISSTTTYTYTNGVFPTEINDNGFITKNTYDLTRGNLISTTSPDNQTYYFNLYDVFNRPLKYTDNLGVETNLEYNWGPDLTNRFTTSVTKTGSPSVVITYDALGREVKKTSNESDIIGTLTTEKVYQEDGRIRSIYYPYKIKSNDYLKGFYYEMEKSLRLTSINDRGLSTRFSYPTDNKLKIQTSANIDDANNPRTWESETNALGLPVSSTNALGQTLFENAYDNSGQPSQLWPFNTTDEAYKVSINYNSFGKVSSFTNSSIGDISYEYNSKDQLVRQADPKDMFKLVHDNLGRVTSKIRDEGEIISYTYITDGAAKGQIESIYFSNDNAEPQKIQYAYDDKGRLNKTSRAIKSDQGSQTYNLETSIAYDQYGNINYRKYASGLEVYYDYDKGLLNKIRTKDHTIWELTSANSYGQPVTIKIADGKYTGSYLYENSVSTQKQYSVTIPKGTFYYQTQFNPNSGNLISRTNMAQFNDLITETFGYDVGDRLKTVNSTQQINYLDNGAIDWKNDAGKYYYQTTLAKPYYIDYIDKTDYPNSTLPELEINTEYFSFNKIKKITYDSKVGEFTYGPDEQRIAMKDYQNGTTYMIYGEGYDALTDANGNITKEWSYIYGPYGLVGVYLNDNGNKTLYNAHTDHLGSVLMLTDIDNGKETKYNYDAWGRRRDPDLLRVLSFNDANNISKTGILRRGFTFHEHLDAYGLINMNGRLYDPIVGRMLSPDSYIQEPDNTQSYNPYAYVFNNPLKYTDPDGELAWFVIPLIIAAVEGGVNVYQNRAAINGDWGKGLAYFGSGAVGGFIQGAAGPGLGSALFSGGTGGFVTGYLNGVIEGKSFAGSLESGTNFAIGGIAGGFIGYPAGQAIGRGLTSLASSKLARRLFGEVEESTVGKPGNWAKADLDNMWGGFGEDGLNSLKPRSTVAIAEESSTIYRAVSQEEATDIAEFGFRMKPGGYETGKLFAPTLQEATQFGKYNFGLDGIPNTIMKVRVSNSVLNGATKFGADGMNAISIPANQLNLLKGIPLNYSPWLR